MPSSAAPEVGSPGPGIGRRDICIASETQTEALHSDLLGECARRRLPRPEVEVIDILSGPRGGIAGRFRLRFDVAVEGPLLLGAGSHFGAGLFAAEYDGPAT